jgi:hypothetical protein
LAERARERGELNTGSVLEKVEIWLEDLAFEGAAHERAILGEEKKAKTSAEKAEKKEEGAKGREGSSIYGVAAINRCMVHGSIVGANVSFHIGRGA